MKVRDRLIVAVVAAVVAIGAVWLLVVSPERNQASALSAQIAAEQTALIPAQASLAAAKAAAAGYAGDVHTIAQVTTAIPTSVDLPNVIATITKLAGTSVNVHELDVGGTSVTSAGPTTFGVTFTFEASYSSLQSFLAELDSLTATDGTNIAASGRLFTVGGVALTPLPPNRTKATVTATTYLQTQGGASTGATAATGATQTAAVTP